MKSVAERVAGPVRGRRQRIVLVDGAPRRGGQAEVYRGVTDLGVTVAVKIALDGEDERRGLIAEREALAAIQGRQIGCDRWLVPLLDEGELPDGRPFLVLPWFEHSLQSWLRSRQPGLGLRLQALERTAEAVVQLHRSSASLAGVVLHRDLKPGNVLIEERPEGLRVVLADLGGAKERKLHDATRNTGIHTPYFAPLEQMLPIDCPPDPSVDVYALAVVIYAVLVGRPPQVVMSRTGLLTHTAEQLVLLHQVGRRRQPEEQERYEALRRAPLDELIEFRHAVALPEDDVRRLRQGLADLLTDQGERAEEVASALTAVLVPALRHALEPNPRIRLSRPEALLAALDAVIRQLGERPPVVQVEEVPTAASSQGAVASEQPRPPKLQGNPRRSRPWMGLAGLATFFLLACAGLFGLMRLDLGPPPGEGAAAATHGLEPALEGPTSDPAPVVTAVSRDPVAAPPVANAVPMAGVGDGRPEPRSQVPVTLTQSKEVPPESTDLAQEEQGAPNPDPLVIVFLVEDDGGATGTVNGRSLGAVLKRDNLGSGEHTVVLKGNIASEPRTFDLVLTPKDDDTWQVALRDTKRKADSPVTRKEGEKVIVRWSKDGRLRFEAARSSDP